MRYGDALILAFLVVLYGMFWMAILFAWLVNPTLGGALITGWFLLPFIIVIVNEAENK